MTAQLAPGQAPEKLVAANTPIRVSYSANPAYSVFCRSTPTTPEQEVHVPLSEHEQRLLEQMERALYAEDPKFATSMRSAKASAGDRRRVAIGVVGLLLGLGLLVAGVAAKLVVVGVLGFLAMLGGLWLAISALTSPGTASAESGATPGPQGPTDISSRRSGRGQKPRQRSGESLSDRMEARWRKRRETGDF